MGNGFSVHLGVDRTLPGRFTMGRFPALRASAKAAQEMARIAVARGFQVSGTFVGANDTTVNAVRGHLDTLAARAQPGDTALFTFAGHGEKKLRDVDGDEPHGDQGLVLYDGMLVDDTIYLHLRKFAKGVRVVFVAECCYGGTIITLPLTPRKAALLQNPNKGLAFRRPQPDADVLLLAASADDETALAATTGLPPFTDALVAIERSPGFPPTYLELLRLVKQTVPTARLYPMDNPTMLTAEPFRP